MPRARSAPAGRSGGSTRKASAASKSSSSRAKSTTRAKAASTTRAKSASTSRAKAAPKRSAAKAAPKRTAARSAPKRTAAKKSASTRAKAGTPDFSGKSVAELRSALKGGVITPLNLVMLTRERIEESLDDAVSRGRMTSSDAQKLATDLLSRGRKQTNEVLRDLDKLLSSGRGDVRKRGSEAASRARKQVGAATARARAAADPVIAQADRARRTVGVGPNFPISGYDDLSVGQIQKRLGTLKPAELRKVRDYERRNANRKGVLSAIETKL
jgi:polyhydroxyalkanoate synthesis regulator phasin